MQGGGGEQRECPCQRVLQRSEETGLSKQRNCSELFWTTDIGLRISGEWTTQVLGHALQAGRSSFAPKQFTLRQGKQEPGLKKTLTNLFRNPFTSFLPDC